MFLRSPMGSHTGTEKTRDSRRTAESFAARCWSPGLSLLHTHWASIAYTASITRLVCKFLFNFSPLSKNNKKWDQEVRWRDSAIFSRRLSEKLVKRWTGWALLLRGMRSSRRHSQGIDHWWICSTRYRLFQIFNLEN